MYINFVDFSSAYCGTNQGAGLGLQLKALTGEIIEQAIRLDFPISNNEAEYKAIITEIDFAIFASSEK